MNPHPHMIRRARGYDIAAMHRLRTEAEQWLQAAGIQQWTDDYHDYAREVLRASVHAGSGWIVYGECAAVAATVTVNGPDPDFWDPEDDPQSALYLGKMIVARDHAGLQLGDSIMNWASLRAAAEGKLWTRLDVRRDNHRLHRYYLARGWVYVRTVDPPRRRTESGVLFQRPAGHVTPAASEIFEMADSRGAGAPWLMHPGEDFRQVVESRPNTWMIRE
jgi:GNAT superfamily N-acetyltransferase